MEPFLLVPRRLKGAAVDIFLPLPNLRATHEAERLIE
jgi:hypothetical protein